MEFLNSTSFHYHSLSEGGTPAKFLIIDDGWQDTTNEFQKEGEPFIDGSQYVYPFSFYVNMENAGFLIFPKFQVRRQVSQR